MDWHGLHVARGPLFGKVKFIRKIQPNLRLMGGHERQTVRLKILKKTFPACGALYRHRLINGAKWSREFLTRRSHLFSYLLNVLQINAVMSRYCQPAKASTFISVAKQKQEEEETKHTHSHPHVGFVFSEHFTQTFCIPQLLNLMWTITNICLNICLNITQHPSSNLF